MISCLLILIEKTMLVSMQGHVLIDNCVLLFYYFILWAMFALLAFLASFVLTRMSCLGIEMTLDLDVTLSFHLSDILEPLLPFTLTNHTLVRLGESVIFLLHFQLIHLGSRNRAPILNLRYHISFLRRYAPKSSYT